MTTTKIRIVDEIPGTRPERGMYAGYWDEMRKTPKRKFLEIPATKRDQILIAAYLYHRGRKAKKPISVSFKEKALYAYWR
jgi:hypothetical protein